MQTPGPPHRSVLITGGAAGLGEQAALTLARRGWTVLITARTPPAGEAAAARLRMAAPGAQVVPLPLDLGDLHSVEALVQRVQAGGPWPPLHAIIANAGVQHRSDRERTAQGFEATFGVNHLGHLHLIRELLDTLAEPGQIVFVSSGTHDPAARHALPFPPPYDLPAAALAFPERFPPSAETDVRAGQRRYASSKLANVQTAFHLARVLARQGRDIRVTAFDPGLMPGTGLARRASATERLLWHHVLPVLARVLPGSVSTAARSGAHLAALLDAPDAAQTAGYFVQGGRRAGPVLAQASAAARDGAKARALWEDSLALLAQVGLVAAEPA